MFKPHIAIFGAGIAGLTCALVLCVHGIKVTLYEKNDAVGGVARSSRLEKGIPSEYSWRGVGNWYKYLCIILKCIPSQTGKGTVFEHLHPLTWTFCTRACQEQDLSNKTTKHSQLTWHDYLVLLQTCISVRMSDTIATDDTGKLVKTWHVNFAEYLKPRLSARGYAELTALNGPWIGVNPERMSLYTGINFYWLNLSHSFSQFSEFQDEPDNWRVFKGPTSEAWFNPWVKLLHTFPKFTLVVNAEVDHILTLNQPHKITQVVLRNGQKVHADQYVFAIGPYDMCTILDRSSPLLQQSLSKFYGLTREEPHVQISFQFAFSSHQTYKLPKGVGVVLIDSPWNLTLYNQGSTWEKDIPLGRDVHTLWSGTACRSAGPGQLCRKTMLQVTRHEFQQEVVHQIQSSCAFQQLFARHNHARSFKFRQPDTFIIWRDWIFPGDKAYKGEEVTSRLPKWVTSTSTHTYMPKTRTKVLNCFLAGAHVKTSVPDIYSMESACESGFKAAALVFHAVSSI